MRMTKRKTTVTLTLHPVSTVDKVTVDAQKAADIPDGIQRINLKIDKLKKLDTGYLQFLLSLAVFCREREIDLNLEGNDPLLKNMCRLYGISPTLDMGAGSEKP
ncbi:hypothetical protein [Desulfobacter latus]|uniref:STAS domain-containing protein n=1 Tax=Desulfobacter latus TaxID=2292 RepID=A0A850SYE7_9BACT|nr:hypothetical protein [Desulfobacter latus]NWH05160.1 hypothetical protein [Desulfobacter latus]